MALGERVLRWLNRLFPQPRVEGRQKLTAYAEYQYGRAGVLLSGLEQRCSFRGKYVIDLGCGPMGMSHYLSQKGAHVIALDITWQYLLVPQSSETMLGSILPVQGSAEALPISSCSMDFILLADTIEHIRAPRQMIRECERVLKPGGILYAAFPPFRSRHGHHLHDYVRIPWAHLLVPDDVLFRLWKQSYQLAYRRGQNFLYPFTPEDAENAETYLSLFSLNQITIRTFRDLLADFQIAHLGYWADHALQFLLKRGILLEYLADYVTCVAVKKG